jgi:hypothetical protein
MYKKIIYLFLLILLSCGQEKEAEDIPSELTDEDFFDVVYSVTAVRAIGNSTWIQPEGFKEFQLLKNSADSNSDSVGTFQISQSNFKLGFGDDDACSGGYNGEYFVISINNTGDDESSFNVLNPTPSENQSSSVVKVFNFEFSIASTGFFPEENCPVFSNSINKQLIRFNDGNVIIKSFEEGLEYFLIPKTN